VRIISRQNFFGNESPPSKIIEKTFEIGSAAKVTYFVSDASGAKRMEEIKDKPAIRVLTLNTQLLPPLMGGRDPVERSISIAKFILQLNKTGPPIDCIALQEVYFDQSRDKLKEILAGDYPHMLAKAGEDIYIVGQDSGLFFASKFPIVWSQFKAFPKGIGPETIFNKGVLGIKLDINNVNKGAHLYLYNAHLQSSPTPDQYNMIHNLISYTEEASIKVRNEQLQFVSKFIDEKLLEEKNKRDTAIILCGTFNVKAEDVKDVKSMNDANAQLEPISKIALLLNSPVVEYSENKENNPNSICYSYQLSTLLQETKISIQYLGQLRNQLRSYRHKSLTLIEMLVLLTIQEIQQKRNSTKANSEEEYQQLILDVLNPILGNSSEKFWNEEVKVKLKEKFPSSIGEKEESPNYDLRKSMVSFGFQFFRSLKYHSGIGFTSAVQVKLIQDSFGCILTETDVATLNFKTYEEFVEELKKLDMDKKSREIEVLNPAPEYIVMMKSLQSNVKVPRDLYRDREKYLSGFTVDKSKNHFVTHETSTGRTDYIISFEPTLDNYDLLKLACTECNICPTSGQAETQLSDHFGVRATLYPRVV